jgi:hypothetical protein
MNQNEIRSELREQHAGLRTMIEEARQAMGRAHESESMRGELRACVGRLSLGLRIHNLREEELLQGILSGVDAWGPARVQIMTEQHVAEHAELGVVLTDANATSDAGIAGGVVLAVLERLLEHMACEEKAFLGDDVLRDDGVVVDQFSG